MPKHPDYLQKILTARVYDVAIETALEKAPNLSARLNNTLLLKREDMQSVFSFKLRGAYNKMARAAEEAELSEGRDHAPRAPATTRKAWRSPPKRLGCARGDRDAGDHAHASR